MRTCLIVGSSSVVAGTPLFAVWIGQSDRRDWQSISFWTFLALAFLPFVANGVLAVNLHRRKSGSFPLMVIPAIVLLPSFDPFPKAITYALPAGLIWFAGCLTLFVTERCRTSSESSA